MPSLPPKQCNSAGCKEYSIYQGRCEKHKPKAWASSEGKTPTERGYGSVWRKIRKQALLRDNHLCLVCLSNGIYTQAQEVDHILNKAQGGDDSLDNLQSICKPCHKRKTIEERKNNES